MIFAENGMSSKLKYNVDVEGELFTDSCRKAKKSINKAGNELRLSSYLECPIAAG